MGCLHLRTCRRPIPGDTVAPCNESRHLRLSSHRHHRSLDRRPVDVELVWVLVENLLKAVYELIAGPDELVCHLLRDAADYVVAIGADITHLGIGSHPTTELVPPGEVLVYILRTHTSPRSE